MNAHLPPSRILAARVFRSALAAALLASPFTPQIHAAAISAGASGDWSSTGTWVGGVVPVSGDTVTVGDTYTVTVASGSSASGNITVNSGGNLTISGGSLTLNTGAWIVANGGILLSDGALTQSTATNILQGSGVFTMTGGNFTYNRSGAAQRWAGTIEISGGNLTWNTRPIGATSYAGAILNIVGEASTISTERWLSDSSTRRATLNYTFGANGVSAITTAGSSTLAQTQVAVDGANYTGGAGSFTLMSGVSVAPSTTTPTASNFTGYNTTFGLSSGNYQLTLTSYSTVWDGGGGDTNINTAANWADDLTPNLTNGHNTFTFGTGGSTATINTNLNAAGIVLNRASSFEIASGAGSFTVGSGGITSSGAAHTISEGVILGADQIWDVTDSLSVSGAVSGAYNLTKAGTGALILSGSNTYTGTTTISAGTIQISHADALGSGANITFSGGALKYGSGVTADLSSRIKNSGSAILVDTNGETVTWGTNLASTNTGGLTKNGSGTLRINVGSAYSGGTTINGGTLQIHNTVGTTPWGPGAIAINNGATLEYTGTQQTVVQGSGDNITFDSSGGGSITMSYNTIWRSSSIITTGGAMNTVSGSAFNGQSSYNVIYDTAVGTDAVALEVSSNHSDIGITKSGLGKIVLTNTTNGMSRAIVIDAGELEIGGAGRLKSGIYNLSITNNGTFSYNSTADQTLSGVISGSGALTKSNSSTLTLTNASNNYTGATTINAGTISVSAVDALGATSGVNLGNATELRYTGSAGDLTRAISVTSGTATVANTGTGVLTLSGGLSKNGTTLVLDGGAQGINVTGAITGSAPNSDLVVDGNVTLSTANSYNGPTTINGNLTAAVTNAMGSTTNVVINSGGSLLVTADNAINDSATINMTGGTLSFSGNVTETVGMLTLSANSIIDLGTDSVAASFADLAMGFYNLSIYNWTGTTLWNGGNGNNTDRIYFNRALTNSELGRISFYSDFGSGFLGTGFQIMSGGFANEVIPVPEPETYATGLLLLLGGCAWILRKRRNVTAENPEGKSLKTGELRPETRNL